MSGIINNRPARACNCVGPQNGDPVCPCAMPGYRERQLGERALDLLRKMGRAGDIKETPAEKAKRIGVPLIPAKQRPFRDPFPHNGTVSVCGECGMEMKRVMGFVCPRSNCPCFLQVLA